MPNPKLPTIADRTFTATETVVLDGRRYERCNFAECTVVYHGRYTELVECIFTPGVAWALQGNALETVLALQSAGFRFVHGKGQNAQEIPLKREPL